MQAAARAARAAARRGAARAASSSSVQKAEAEAEPEGTRAAGAGPPRKKRKSKTAEAETKTARTKKGKAEGKDKPLEDDGKVRCGWCNGTSLYRRYHDEEWGVPVREDDRKLFEMLSLEGAQAGLSWYTILQKREGYRKHFRNFEIDVVAKLGATDVEEMMKDPGVVRHRGKLESVLSNARLAQLVTEEHGSLSAYLWTFAPEDPLSNPDRNQPVTPEAKRMSNDLKKRGFKFVGPTICHAFMQAVGMFNDHHPDCFRYTGEGGTSLAKDQPEQV